MPERLIVIGGDAAGMSAASQARRQRPSNDLEILAFERSSWVSYSACGEPYYVGGYVTEALHHVSQRPVNIHLGTIANKQGRLAGINIGGQYATFPGVLGTAITKVCDLEIACTGLTEAEATKAGFAYHATTVDSTTTADYWPDAENMRLKIVAERGSGRLLGAQIVGGQGAGKRIDVLATAMWNNMWVDELMQLDLAYAPPFAPVWDPVLIATRKTWETSQ